MTASETRARGASPLILALLLPACWSSQLSSPASPARAPAPSPSPSPGTEAYDRIEENDFVAVAEDPLSTFSIDVDTAAYANVRRFLRDGRRPPPDAVRIEELLNYFTYDDPAPRGDAPLAVSGEAGPAPWAPGHRLVRVGVRARPLEQEDRARNLTFLLDVSGSMGAADKLPLLKSALRLLVDHLGARDRVAIVVYAGAAGVVLEPTPGDEKEAILAALERLSAGGSTAGGAGIERAYALARESFDPEGVNRVLLATDGDFNVGPSDRGELERIIDRERARGIFLTVLGLGTGNLKDSRMEALAKRGQGSYAYIDSLDEARKVLVEEAGGTFTTVASDVKIQVEMNPAEVERYRLIGYENRLLRHRDFRDDAKDAGEVGAGHSIVALYEVVPREDRAGPPADAPRKLRYRRPGPLSQAAASGELLTARVRYQPPEGGASRELEVPIVDAGSSSDDLRFAAAVAAFGMTLRDSPHRGEADLELALELARGALGQDPGGYRRGFVALLERAQSLSR